ncbi:MAG: peptidylprolyl isomerase [Geobacter sp.]|nr:MAG: peptidylprolyl isomerase [Geobacter sp.]
MILAALWSYRKCGKANIYQKENIMKRASARHILVASKEVCENLKAEIDGGKDFAAVAKENSLCPSKRDGGALGTFSPGQMVKEFDEVVFTGEVGKVLGPVKTQFGYHLIEITSRTE